MQIDWTFYDALKEFHIDIDYLNVSLNELTPLKKIASSRLHSAVFSGEMTRVQLLVEVFHCSPLTINREGYTSLHIAAICGDLNILKYFIEERLVNAASESVSQKTPLHCAAANGQLSIAEYLVGTQQVDPLVLDEDLVSPLHMACVSGSLKTVRYMIHVSQQHLPHHVNTAERTSRGHILIHYAAKSGSPEVINILLTSSALFKKEDVNSRDKVITV